MTKQEAAQGIWDWFFVQGNKLSKVPWPGYEGERCVYRGPGGERCAVGCILPDELYSEGIEGWGADYLGRYGGDEVGKFVSGIGGEFLRHAQLAHDDAEDKDAFRVSLLKVFANFGVEIDRKGV